MQAVFLNCTQYPVISCLEQYESCKTQNSILCCSKHTRKKIKKKNRCISGHFRPFRSKKKVRKMTPLSTENSTGFFLMTTSLI